MFEIVREGQPQGVRSNANRIISRATRRGSEGAAQTRKPAMYKVLMLNVNRQTLENLGRQLIGAVSGMVICDQRINRNAGASDAPLTGYNPFRSRRCGTL